MSKLRCKTMKPYGIRSRVRLDPARIVLCDPLRQRGAALLQHLKAFIAARAMKQQLVKFPSWKLIVRQ